MRVGMFLLAARFPGQLDDEVLAATVRAAAAAERAGFDDVWLAEHHFMSYGICPLAVTLAGYVLGQTSRVHVGTAVSVLPAWHPVAPAEQAALLDQVSGVRFRLGIGRGGPWLQLEVFGTGLARYEGGSPRASTCCWPRCPWAGSARTASTSGSARSPWCPGRGHSPVRRSWWRPPRRRQRSWRPPAGCRCCSGCTPTTTPSWP